MHDPGSKTGASYRTVTLADRPDFRLGNVLVQPSLRNLRGPAGEARGEPRVVQVLLALADGAGAVLSRDDLLRICWDGRIVGDDAINRAMGELRRLVAQVGADFEIETIPRVGFRIAGLENGQAAPAHRPAPTVSRRTMVGAGLAAVGAAAAAGAAAIVWNRRRDNARIDALIERGRVLQGSGLPDGDRRAEALFRQVITREPSRADAWGWLAVVSGDEARAREAATQALELDPAEPNARTVLALQRRDLDSWTEWEEALLGVLADAPGCALALNHLTFFYQGMGRCRASRALNERAIAAEPFNPIPRHRRALKDYIFGEIGDADKVADQALRLWPRDGQVWNARVLIYAFTGRGEAGLALLDDAASRPGNLTAPAIASWRAALTAVATRSRRDIDTAVRVMSETASGGPGLAANAIMAFSYLGELDPAYRVAAGLFEGRGPMVQRRRRAASTAEIYATSQWGRTQFLFIPATANFRADARFPELCRRMGHVAYWRERGIWPDPFVRGAIDPARLA